MEPGRRAASQAPAGDAKLMSKKNSKSAEAPFSILARGPKMVSAVRESLSKVEATARRMHFSLGPDERLMIPTPEFLLQTAIRSRGFFSGTLLDILGGDGLGKTTLGWTIIGWFLRHNCPALHIETENKAMLPGRVQQALHTNRALAAQMYAAVQREQAFTVRDAVVKVNEWLMTIRNPKSGPDIYVPLNYPAIVVVDTFSKLLAPTQAGNVSYYAGEGKAENKRDLGEGSNQEHAKLAHAWCRELPTLLRCHNAVLVMLRHQNEDVDMSGGGGGSFISPEVKATFNRKSIGGQAFSQNAALQFILTRKNFDVRQISGERVKVGMNVKLTVSKNSFGPPGDCVYTVTLVPQGDTAEIQTPAISWANQLPEVISDEKLLPITIRNARSLVCREFGLDELTPEQFHALLHSKPELINNLAQRMQLTGYGPMFITPPADPAFAGQAPDEPIVDDASKAE